jgi:hypothetical protein
LVKIGIPIPAALPYGSGGRETEMDGVSRRPLTEDEKHLVAEVFGQLDLERVRLCAGDGHNPFAEIAFRIEGVDAITLIRTIFFKSGLAADFSKDGQRPLFLHEMTHIWQFQRLGLLRFGLRYLRDLVAHRFNRRALYQYHPGDVFAAATLEAQAQMVQERADNLAGTGLYGR